MRSLLKAAYVKGEPYLSDISRVDRDDLYSKLLLVAKKKTADADVELDDSGRPIEDGEALDLGENVLIVGPEPLPDPLQPAAK